MSLFGVPSTSSGQALRLRLSQETAPNSAQDDEFNGDGSMVTDQRWRIQWWRIQWWRIQWWRIQWWRIQLWK